jgi:hypothetical protein
MSAPRNVTPGYENDQFPPGTFPNSGHGPQSDGMPPEWTGWSWMQNRERSFPWLGLLLVVVGAGLAIQYFVPAISTTTLVLAGIAAVFFTIYAFGGPKVVLIPGLLIGALVVARLIDELNIYNGEGTTAIAVAVAFLVIWLLGLRGPSRRRSMWPLWGAAIFGLVGFIELMSSVSTLPILAGVWPVLLIGIGLLVVLSGGRGSPRRF